MKAQFLKLALRRVPLLWLLLLILPATFPLWTNSYLWTDDGTLHLYRIVALDRALQTGMIFPRWAPDLVSGYGVPLFNYYSPLTYYWAEALHVLGLNIYDAVRVCLALIILIAGVGTYLLARDMFCSEFGDEWKRQAAALLVAVAYVYTPYFFVDLYYRGALPEAFGMGLLPAVLWATRRTARLPQFAPVITTAGLLALWVAGHILTVLIASPLVIGLGLLELIFHSTWRARVFGLIRLGGGALLGGMMSAFYWLPAFSEQGLTRAGSLSSATGLLPQYIQDHLSSLGRLVDLSWLYTYRTPAPWQIPIFVLILLVVSVPTAWYLKASSRAAFLWCCALAVISFLMMGDWTRALWVAHPSWSFIQFPWRLSPIIALAAALGTGVLVIALDRLRAHARLWGAIAVLLGVNAVLVGALHLQPVTSPIAIGQSLDLASMARWEVNFNTLGAGDPHEYIPIHVKALPREVNRQLLDTHLLSTDQVSDIQLEQAGPTQMVYRIRSAVATSVFFRTFYFPDWQVLVDSQPASAQARTAFGILGVSLPAGEHRLTVARGTTLSRQWGEGLTWLGLLLTVVLLVLAARRREVDVALPVLLLVVTGVIAALALWPSFVRPLSDYAPAQLDLNPNLHVIGYSADEVGNDALHVRVMWQARLPITEDAPIHWRLLDGNGSPVSEFRQRSRYGTGLMTTWLPNEIAFDDFDLPLNGAAAGNYLLQVAADNSAWMPLGHVMLPRAAPGFRPPEPAHPVQARLGDSIDLLGYSTDGHQVGADLTAQPGERLPLTFYWTTHDGVLDDLAVFIHVVDSTGNLVAQEDSQPNQRFSPTYAWLPGRVVADTHVLLLPADIPPGTYHLLVGMYSFPSIDRLPVKGTSLEDDTVDIATLHVQPVER